MSGKTSSASARSRNASARGGRYKAIRTSMICARARALARLGDHRAADRALGAAVRACPRGAVDPLDRPRSLEGALPDRPRRRDDRRGSISAARLRRAAPSATATTRHGSPAPTTRSSAAGRGRRTPHAHERSVTDTALLVTDIATILGAGHSIGLIAHRTAALLQGTTLGPRVSVQDEAGCEYSRRPDRGERDGRRGRVLAPAPRIGSPHHDQRPRRRGHRGHLAAEERGRRRAGGDEPDGRHRERGRRPDSVAARGGQRRRRTRSSGRRG